MGGATYNLVNAIGQVLRTGVGREVAARSAGSRAEWRYSSTPPLSGRTATALAAWRSCAQSAHAHRQAPFRVGSAPVPGMPDWYSPHRACTLTRRSCGSCRAQGVVVEATEFGDVLVLADGVEVAQGVELGAENSTEYDEYWQPCGVLSACEVEHNAAAAGHDFGAQWLNSALWADGASVLDKHTARVQPIQQREATSADCAGRPLRGHRDCYDLKNANVFLPLAAIGDRSAGAWAAA